MSAADKDLPITPHPLPRVAPSVPDVAAMLDPHFDARAWRRESTASADAAADEPLGAILVECGRLSADDRERIQHLQRDKGLDFDEAGLKLGLLTSEDLQFARARQFGYPWLFEGDGQLAGELVAAYQPFSLEAETLRALRTELKLRWFTGAPRQRLMAVVSPERGDGRSFLAGNLAVEFSQLGERTLLIDADLRRPRQHQLFNLVNRIGLSTALAQQGAAAGGPIDLHASLKAIQHITALPDLAVMTAGPQPPNPQELLGRPAFGRFLELVAREFDVVLIDTPAASLFADAQTVAARAGAAMLVVRRDRSRMDVVHRLAEGLVRHGVTVAGSVLNEY